MSKALVVELGTADGAIAAARALRQRGHRALQAYTPYGVEELAEAIGLTRSRIPRFVFAAALTGFVVAFAILRWTSAIDSPLNVGGRPLWSWPADIPIVFETTVLFAGITAFTLALAGSGLPKLHDPIMDVEGFERTSVDRFWVVATGDDVVDDASLRAQMIELGALAVHTVERAS